MPPFPCVRLLAAPRAIRLVRRVVWHMALVRAIVAAEYNQRALIQSCRLQGIHQRTQHRVRLNHKVAIVPHARLPPKLLVRQAGCMRRRKREVEKERTRPALGCAHKIQRTLLQFGQHLGMIKVRCHGTGPPKARPLRIVAVSMPRGLSDNVVVLHVHIRVHVQRCGYAEESIKAEVRGVGVQRLAVIRLALEPQPQMPFANTGGVITRFLAEGRQSGTTRLDETGRISKQHAVLQFPPPRIAPRQQRIPRRRTHPRRGMRIGKAHSLAGKPVHVRCGYRRFRVVALDIAIAQIIRQHHDNVRGLLRRGNAAKCKQESYHDHAFHRAASFLRCA